MRHMIWKKCRITENRTVFKWVTNIILLYNLKLIVNSFHQIQPTNNISVGHNDESESVIEWEVWFITKDDERIHSLTNDVRECRILRRWIQRIEKVVEKWIVLDDGQICLLLLCLLSHHVSDDWGRSSLELLCCRGTASRGPWAICFLIVTHPEIKQKYLKRVRSSSVCDLEPGSIIP